MNSEYIKKNNLHEKYILGQLSSPEKNEYEAFIAENAEAREALEQERRLINGIRFAGASELKKEIQRQVETIRHPKTDWTLIYKAAAILLVFVLLPSVIYYENYRSPGKSTEQVVQTEKPASIDKDDSFTTDEIAVEKEGPSDAVLERTTPIKEVASSPPQRMKKESRKQEAEEEPPTGSLSIQGRHDVAERESYQARSSAPAENLNAAKSMALGSGSTAKLKSNFNENFISKKDSIQIKLIFDKRLTGTIPDSLKILTEKTKLNTIITVWVPQMFYQPGPEKVGFLQKDGNTVLTFLNFYRYIFPTGSSDTYARKVSP